MQTLDEIRVEIDQIDTELKKLMDRRFEISKKVGENKKITGKAVYDEKREKLILDAIKNDSTLINAEQVAKLYEKLMQISCEIQDKIVKGN